MMMRQKTKKFRGSRTFGAGKHKKRRGGGSRGGRGRAGGCKHHFVRALQEGRPFGKYGFKRPLKVISKKATINVGTLDQISSDLLFAKKTKSGAIHIDVDKIGVDKVLGGGKVTKKLIITASEFSESAKSKIEGAGGKCVLAK
ncbi:MAG: uL15m family ribosomal protein [Methanocellales archaeon]|nr:uL15m family ribosomal protein [Methanocellales archaeon]